MARTSTIKAPAKTPAKADPTPTPAEVVAEEEIEKEETEEQEEDESEEEETEEEVEASAAVYDEILDLCRTKEAGGPDFKSQQPKETPQAYLERIIRTISDMTDDEEGTLFNTLPEAAQSWYNDACDEMTEKKPITLPDGFVALEPPTSRKGAGKKAAANGASTDPAPRKAAAKKEKAAKEPRAEGIVSKSRKIILANIGKDRKAVRAMLPEVGDATFAVQWGWITGCVKDIKDMGHWKD